MATAPAHGDERNRHIHTTHTTSNFVSASGEKYELNYCSSELTVVDKYCTHCAAWVSTKPLGIIGFIACPKCHRKW
jgi:hypothetical protein